MPKETAHRKSDAAAIYIVVGGMLVFLVAVGIAASLDTEVGTTPEWISAIATLAAFVAASIAGYTAHKVLVLEDRREEARINAERSQQAVLIAAWPILQFATMPDDDTIEFVHIQTSNQSTMPVVDVELAVYADEREIGTLSRPQLPPTGELPKSRDLRKESSVVSFFGLWAAREWSDNHGYDELPEPHLSTDISFSTLPEFTCEVWFTDAAGERWHRDRKGRLQHA